MIYHLAWSCYEHYMYTHHQRVIGAFVLPPYTGSVMQLDSLKSRVDKSALPSQMLQTSRGGTKNVSL